MLVLSARPQPASHKADQFAYKNEHKQAGDASWGQPVDNAEQSNGQVIVRGQPAEDGA